MSIRWSMKAKLISNAKNATSHLQQKRKLAHISWRHIRMTKWSPSVARRVRNVLKIATSSFCTSDHTREKSLLSVRFVIERSACLAIFKNILILTQLISPIHAWVSIKNCVRLKLLIYFLLQSFCNLTFKTQRSLKFHTVAYHQPEAKVSCQHCDKSFVNKSYLKVHMLYHTGELS